MMSVLVDRATSSKLIGPDSAMNTEICEIINRDRMQAKYVVKSLKGHLKSKNPKVLLLTLTLLEAVLQNCRDVVQIHVSEKQVLQLLVKILRKKHDFHVKEKILDLIYTWQETFGDPWAQYPEYYALQQELLHVEGLFPENSNGITPTISPSHSRISSKKPEEPKYSDGSDFHTLSPSTEINAVDPFQKSLLTTSSFTDERDVSAVGMMVDPPVDLLSWDYVGELSIEISQAPVPMKDPTTSSTVVEKPLVLAPMNYQDILDLTFVDGFSSNSTNVATDPFGLHSSYLLPQEYSSSNGIQTPPNELHSNGVALNAGARQYEQENYVQKPKMNQIDLILNKDVKQSFNLQQPLHSGINIHQTEEALPLPPWEIQSTEEIEPQLIVNPQLSNLQSSQSMQSGEEAGMYKYGSEYGIQGTGMQLEPAVVGRQMEDGRKIAGMQIQTVMQEGPLVEQRGVDYYNQMRSGYPFPSRTDLSQSMHEFSMHGHVYHINPCSHQNQMHTPSSPSSSSVPEKKQLKPARLQDNLFGDLVNIARIKSQPNKQP